LTPDESFSAGKFGEEAEATANSILQQNKIPVVVGGSGLYVQSLCEGFFKEIENEQTPEIRKKLDERLLLEGIDSLYKELKEVDHESYLLYNDKNPRRIIRALEYFYLFGSPISLDRKQYHKTRGFDVVYYGIDVDRQGLYDKINSRVDLMWKHGLLAETQNVLEMGYSKSLNSLNTVGYKETIAFLEKKLSKTEAIEMIKQNTRHYAKRQMTWFRRNEHIIWLNGTVREIAERIAQDYITIDNQIFSL
jgi:tRNA dimethylallyltransferase